MPTRIYSASLVELRRAAKAGRPRLGCAHGATPVAESRTQRSLMRQRELRRSRSCRYLLISNIPTRRQPTPKAKSHRAIAARRYSRVQTDFADDPLALSFQPIDDRVEARDLLGDDSRVVDVPERSETRDLPWLRPGSR